MSGRKQISNTFTVNALQDGRRGKVGRFFYYADIFKASDNTKHFVVNDAQAPYFEHIVDGQKRYHVYNPEENPVGGTLTMSQMWANSEQSWNNAPWEVMTNDFKYLITEAIFGNFASFASFLMTGNWLMSNQGTIAGKTDATTIYNIWEEGQWVETQQPSYTFFDPIHINGEDKTSIWEIHASEPWQEGDLPYSTPVTLEEGLYYIECRIKYCKIYLKDSSGNMYLLADAGNGGSALAVSAFFKLPHQGAYTLVMEEYTGETAEVVNSGGFYKAQFLPYIAINGSDGRIYHHGGNSLGFYANYFEMISGLLGRFRIKIDERGDCSFVSPYDLNQLDPDNFVQITPDGQMVLIHKNNSSSTQTGTSEALRVEGNVHFGNISNITCGNLQLYIDNGFVKAR